MRIARFRWDESMLYRSLARFLLLLNLPIFLTGQASHRSSFDWDSPKFHHLDYFNSHVSEAKNLSADLKPALVRAIEAHLRPQMADLEIANEKELRKIAEQSRFELVDLNADGVSEVVVQPIGLKAGCGATGNCPFWVFALGGGKYRLILGTSGQMYRVESHGSNGYSDISVADHDSATEKTIYQFRFLRGQYKKIACYQAWWSTTDGRLLERPIVNSCPGPSK